MPAEHQLTEHITADMFERDRDKLYALTHDYFKRLLMEWEDDLNSREGELAGPHHGPTHARGRRDC